ncbi:MAG: M60 family metallopeptidase [Gemmataceae bacterium]
MPRGPLAALVLAVFAVALPARQAPPAQAPFHVGVREIGFPGLPGTVVVFGPKAFPVVTAPAGKAAAAVVAAGETDRGGRVVLFGHEGYLVPPGLGAGDTTALVTNAIHWAAGGKATEVMVQGFPQAATEALRAAGFPAAVPKGALKAGGKGSVIVCNAHRIGPEYADTLARHLAAGGGVVAAGPGWGWEQTHPGKPLAVEHHANRAFAAAGLMLAGGTLDAPKDKRLVVGPPSRFTHVAAAEALVAAAVKGAAAPAADARTSEATLTRALRYLPPEEQAKLSDRLTTALAGAAAAVPSAKEPLRAGSPERLTLALRTKLALELPAERTTADPAAVTFPGGLPADAPRVQGRAVTVRTGVPGYVCDGVGVSATADVWHSTGVYAAPGEVVRVTVPAAAAGQGLGVRIGAHTDELWHLDRWQRAPQVSRWVPLASKSTAVANPFGGLVYVTAPVGARLGDVTATIDGGVAAPVFFAGKTTADEWAKLRAAPAPWGEFVSDKFVLTVPAEVARTVENPAEVVAFWDAVLDGCADLTAVTKQRGRAERLVFDQQISAGYLHSGYPIMGPLNLAPLAVDVPRMKRGGPGEGPWGFFHELGHNHQQREWTFDGTVEVTCNLYSLYLLEKLCPGAPVHDAIRGPSQSKNAAKHKAAGAPFAGWKDDPFVALIVYDQLRRSFGWDVYKKTFAEYHAAAPADRPRTDAARRDQFVVRFSKVAGKNIAPAFEAWGVPVGEAAKREVMGLPAWEPPAISN